MQHISTLQKTSLSFRYPLFENGLPRNSGRACKQAVVHIAYTQRSGVTRMEIAAHLGILSSHFLGQKHQDGHVEVM